MRIILAAILFCIILRVAACTEQERARNLGGSATLTLPCGEKLVTATWKETQLWYLTREMKEGDVVDSYDFRESSSYGVLEGAVKIKECVK